MTPPKKAFALSSLQAGRALAALAVLSFHLSLMMGDAGFAEVGRSITWRGDLGVDFFFVLSGFIILHAHQDDLGRPERLGRYLYRRFVRLYPIYWLFTAVVLVGLMTFARHNHPPSGAAEWFTAITLVRLSPAPTPIHPAWTLIHEIAFYAVFACAVANRIAGLALFALWMALCVAVFHYTGEFDRTPWMTYTSAINLNFGIGMAAQWLHRQGRLSGLTLIAGIAGFVATFSNEALGGHPAPLFYAISFGLIISGLATLEQAGRLKARGLLLALGDASYVLYISHEFVATILLRIFRLLHGHVPDVAVYALVLTLTAGIGLLAHRIVEKPLLGVLRRLEPGRGKAGAAALPAVAGQRV